MTNTATRTLKLFVDTRTPITGEQAATFRKAISDYSGIKKVSAVQVREERYLRVVGDVTVSDLGLTTRKSNAIMRAIEKAMNAAQIDDASTAHGWESDFTDLDSFRS